MMTIVRPIGVSEIVLTKGQVTLVDTCLLEYLSQWKWYATRALRSKRELYYAVRSEYIKGSGHRSRNNKIMLHRQIFIWCGIETETVDHINGDRLDNRLTNLRPATWSQNSINAQKHRDNTSGYKGVCWAATKNKWKAVININKKRTFLGYFLTREEAAIAYNKAAHEHYGEYAYLNEVPIC